MYSCFESSFFYVYFSILLSLLSVHFLSIYPSLKQQASVLLFLEQNHISDFAELLEKNKSINQEFLESSKRLKAVDRRLETLSQHLEQCQQHKQYQTVNQKYKSLDPKKREAFYEKHEEKLERFAEAKQYLTAVLNGRTKIPVNEWKAEQKKLQQERIDLCEKFYAIKDDVRNMEVLRRGLDNLIKESPHEIKDRYHSV